MNVEICSCDESVALRAEVARLRAALAKVHAVVDVGQCPCCCAIRCMLTPPPSVPVPATLTARQRNGWSSGYKGVYWHRHSAKWRARVRVDGKRVSLGTFGSENEAADAVALACKGGARVR